MSTKRLIYVALTLVILLMTSCGEYQQILKSKDPDEKFRKALEFFDKQEYMKAQTLFDDVAPYYKGTERFEEVVCYQARAHLGQKDYSNASDYYQAYIRNYPKGKHITEARFQLKQITLFSHVQNFQFACFSVMSRIMCNRLLQDLISRNSNH